MFGWDAALEMARISATREQYGDLMCKLRVLSAEATEIATARRKAEQEKAKHRDR